MAVGSRWTGASKDGKWYSPGNWFGGVPVAGRTAKFTDGGDWTLSLQAARTDPAAVAGTLAITGDHLTLTHGTLDLAPPPAPRGPTYDVVLANSASLTIAAGATLSGTQTLVMGLDGSATNMVVEGTVAEEFAVVESGSLLVTTHGHWIGGLSGLYVGGLGNGTLIVSDGGTVDGGPHVFDHPAARLQLGDNFGDGSALVTGLGSTLIQAMVEVGGGYGGTLTIAAGGHVKDLGGLAGNIGDGSVIVTGAGSLWQNIEDIQIGGAVPVAASLTVTDGGEVSWGKYGFTLFEHLNLDGSAILTGRQIVDGGGQIQAVAGRGDVTLSQTVTITSSRLENREVAYFDGAPGAALRVSGRITGDAQSIFEAGIGQVVLSNGANSFGAAQIYAATLEVAAQGALGKGDVSFVGGTVGGGLRIDRGITLQNTIDGFQTPDSLDLSGFAFAARIKTSWTENRAGTGGMLTMMHGASTTSLSFHGTYDASSFAFASDHHGGTLVTLAKTS